MAIHTLGDSNSRDEDKDKNRKGSSSGSFGSDDGNPLPPVTKWLLIALGSAIFLIYSSLLSPDVFIHSYFKTFKRFQLYRIITSSLIIPVNPSEKGIGMIMECYNFYQRSRFIEVKLLHGVSLDYIHYLTFIILGTTFVSTLLFITEPYRPLLLYHGMSSAMAYTYSLCNESRSGKIVLYGVIPMVGWMYPAVDLFLTFLFSGEDAFYISLVGVTIAYIFQCLDTKSWGPISWAYQNYKISKKIEKAKAKSRNYVVDPSDQRGVVVRENQFRAGPVFNNLVTGYYLPTFMWKHGQKLGSAPKVDTSKLEKTATKVKDTNTKVASKTTSTTTTPAPKKAQQQGIVDREKLRELRQRALENK